MRLKVCLFSLAVVCTFFPVLSTPVVTGSAVRQFLGNRAGKCVYTKWEGLTGYDNGVSLWYVDFSEDVLVERQVVNTTASGGGSPQNPLISDDGNWITYNVRTVINNIGYNKSYVCQLKENATPALIADTAAQPHWWVKPGTTDEYLIFNNGDLMDVWQSNWPPNDFNAKTYIIPLVNKQASGSKVLMFPYLANGGRSRDGAWMVVAGRSTGIFKVDPLATGTTTPIAITQFNTAVAGCNPSTSPHTVSANVKVIISNDVYTYQGKTLVPHQSFAIRTTAGAEVKVFVRDPTDGNLLWDCPEWSNDTNYAAGCASPAYCTSPFDIYLVRLSDNNQYRIIDGNYQWPDLWVAQGTRAVEKSPAATQEIPRLMVCGRQGAMEVKTGNVRTGTVTVFDISGKMIRQKQIGNESTTTVSGLASGYYRVTVAAKQSSVNVTSSVIVY
jgi:hypothetical protein